MSNIYFQVNPIEDNCMLVKLRDKKSNLCKLTYKINSDINTIYLYTIQTDKRFRKCGFATMMMGYFIECFRDYNILAKVMDPENNYFMKILIKNNFEEINLVNEIFMIRYSDS